jgi:ribosomal-protein-serine acetyltransferase
MSDGTLCVRQFTPLAPMSIAPRIRRYRPEDVDAIYEAVVGSKAELAPWMPWCHDAYSKSDTRSWVESRGPAWESNEDWSFVIVDDGDRIVGGTGLHRIDLRNGVAEVGYWVRTCSTRQGVAKSAVRQLCEWAFRERGLRRLEILSAVENVPSQRVALASGFVREAILRERIVLRERPHDCMLFSILKTEFERLKPLGPDVRQDPSK